MIFQDGFGTRWTALDAESGDPVEVLSFAPELVEAPDFAGAIGERVYLAAEAYPQADSEFDRCINRRGEALALFLDEEPTFGFLPMVHYYQGKVREAMKSTRAAESYRAYLDIRGRSTEDPRVAELRPLVGPP